MTPIEQARLEVERLTKEANKAEDEWIKAEDKKNRIDKELQEAWKVLDGLEGR